MEAVKTYIIDLIEAEDDLEDAKHPRKRKRLEMFDSDVSEEKNNNKVDQDSEVKISPEIKRRRKQMSMRNPLKNLLMRTLKKTHARNLKHEMLKAGQSQRRVKKKTIFKQIPNMRKT